MLLLVVYREGSGRRGCGGRWRNGNDAQRSYGGTSIVVVSLLQIAVISVCQQTARYWPRPRPLLASVMVAAAPTSSSKEGRGKKGTIHQNRNIKAAPSLTVGYTGNARTNRSKRGQKWAALTLTAVQGVQHSRGASAPIAPRQAAFNPGGGGSPGMRRLKRPRPSHKTGSI